MGGPLAGFDPAAGMTEPEGNPDGLERAASDFAGAAGSLGGHEGSISKAAGVPTWQGSAASAYGDTTTLAARYTNQSSDAFTRAAQATKDLATQLRAAKEKARSAIARAEAMRSEVAGIGSQWDTAQSLPAPEAAGVMRNLGMYALDVQSRAAALRGEVADAHDDARRARQTAAGRFGEIAAMTPSTVARRTQEVLSRVYAGDYVGANALLGRMEKNDYLSVAAQERIASEVATAVQANLDDEQGVGQLQDLSALVHRFRRDDEFAASFYNTMGGDRAAMMLGDARRTYLYDDGVDQEQLIALVAPFATMLGTATRSGKLYRGFSEDFTDPDVDDAERGPYLEGMKDFVMAGSASNYSPEFLSAVGERLLLEPIIPIEMVSEPEAFMNFLAGNNEASALLLAGTDEHGIANAARLFFDRHLHTDDGEALGALLQAGTHDLRFYDYELASDAAHMVVVSAPEFAPLIPDGAKPALVTIFDDHIGDFEYVAMQRAMPGVMDDATVIMDELTYEEGRDYLEMLYGDESTRRGTSEVVGERVAWNIRTSVWAQDTDYANRAGAVSGMSVLAMHEADLDQAEWEDARDGMASAAAGELIGLTPVGKIPLSGSLVGKALEEIFPADSVREALEQRLPSAIDQFQRMHGLAIAMNVEQGNLPRVALEMVNEDGTINPNFIPGANNDEDVVLVDTNQDGTPDANLHWDLSGDDTISAEEREITERELYDVALDTAGAAHNGMDNVIAKG